MIELIEKDVSIVLKQDRRRMIDSNADLSIKVVINILVFVYTVVITDTEKCW